MLKSLSVWISLVSVGENMAGLKINPRCITSCIGHLCQRKLHFIASLPFDEVWDLGMAVKMATVRLCASCPDRMFVLPNYALSPTQKAKYELLWRNRDIVSALVYGKTRYADKKIGK